MSRDMRARLEELFVALEADGWTRRSPDFIIKWTSDTLEYIRYDCGTAVRVKGRLSDGSSERMCAYNADEIANLKTPPTPNAIHALHDIIASEYIGKHNNLHDIYEPRKRIGNRDYDGDGFIDDHSHERIGKSPN